MSNRYFVVGLCGMMACSSPAFAESWAGQWRVSDATLAMAAGKGDAATRLSTIVDDVSTSQAQRVSEDLRVGSANWFSDNNVLSIANMAIVRG